MFFVLKLQLKTNIVYSQIPRDFARFPVFTVGTLVENLLVCGVLSLSHRSTPHTIEVKTVLMFVVSHILKIL